MQKIQKLVDIWVASDGSEHRSEFLCQEAERKLDEVKGLTEQQEWNRQTLEEQRQQVELGRQRWVDHPEEKEAFDIKCEASALEFMKQGVE
jgi:hypothetical protein